MINNFEGLRDGKIRGINNQVPHLSIHFQDSRLKLLRRNQIFIAISKISLMYTH